MTATVDLFSGPRGWDVGARLIGLPDALGIEWDASACATSNAAGFPTLQADVSAVDPLTVAAGATGLIASPPCTMFSRAGGNHGNQAIPLLLDAMEQCYRGNDVRAEARDYEVDGAVDEDGYRTRDWHPTDGVAPTLTEKARSWTREPDQVLLQPGGAGFTERTNDDAADAVPGANRRLYDPETEPAPTIAFGNDAANWCWVDRLNDQSGDGDDGTWMLTQPATVVATRPLVPHPGANANRYNGKSKSRNDGVRVTLTEAALLQSFPADHPWQGNMTETFRQVGNAIPPLLAAHVLAAITGLPAPSSHPCPTCNHETATGRWDNCGGCAGCEHLHVTP